MYSQSANAAKARRAFLRNSLKVLAATTAGGAGVVSSINAAAGDAMQWQPVLSQAVVTPKQEPIVHEPDKRLRLVNAHTWEKLDVVYWSEGSYIDESLDQINHVMRDHREDKTKAIDKQLIDDLHRLYLLMDTKERVHVLSGYRTPETNAKLRKRSNGVAKYSLHMEGRAVDINIPGKTARQIQSAALSMGAGGVGYYKRSGFVHIDTGNVRSWQRA